MLNITSIQTNLPGKSPVELRTKWRAEWHTIRFIFINNNNNALYDKYMVDYYQQRNIIHHKAGFYK